jgi:uncharacterized repeat protein (TIGR02543 family)
MNTTLTWRWKTQYHLSLLVSPEIYELIIAGIITVYPASPDGYYDAKSTIALTAIANEGFDFSYWTGGLRGTANPQNLLLRGPRTVTANFIPEKRYFTVFGLGLPDPPPSPIPPVGIHEYYYGDTVTANCGTTPYCPVEPPGIRYVCTGHIGTGSCPSGPEPYVLFVIYEDSSVTWTWQTQYRLTTAANSPERGTVSPSGETWHNEGAIVSVTATGTLPYGFLNWSGDLSGSENPKNITMSGPKSVTANFDITLTVSNPSGCDTPVPAAGTYAYVSGAEVTCSVTSPGAAPVSETTALTYPWLSDPRTDHPDSNMGFRFTTKANMLITKVMTYRGNGTVPVTIWTDSGTILRTIQVPGCSAGVWTEAAVVPPLELAAGQVYRIATYYNGSDTNYICLRTAIPINPDLTVTEGCYESGSGFPATYWPDYVCGVCNFRYVKSRGLCTGYTGTGSCPSGTGNSVTFTITQASFITWNWQIQHALFTTVTPEGTGTIELSPASADGYYNEGTVVTLTAAPSAAYIFKEWSEDLTGTTNPQTLTMNLPKRVTANFEKPKLIVSNPQSYDTPVPAANTQQNPYYLYDCGTSVTCSVTSPFIDGNSRYTCTGYTGTGSCPASGSEISVTFAIERHSTITWNWVAHYKLATTANPSGGGTVARTPDLEWYDSGATVELSATANAGYTFTGWSGNLTGSVTPASITMNGPKSVTAEFKHAVVVTSPYGSPSPPVGTIYYDHGSSVTLSCGTTPFAGPQGVQYVCTGWTGGTGDISPATGTGTSFGPFSITQNSTITWTWKTQYYLTTSVTPTFPANGGTITRSPDQVWYDSGSVVQLTANPASGFAFGNWSGDLSGTENPKDIVMDGPKSVVANFTILTPRTVTVTSPYGEPNPPVGATSCPDGYAVPLSCGPTPYPVDATGTRYACTGWTGGSGDVPLTGIEPSYTITAIHNDSTITWTWKTQYQLTTAVAPAGSGSVTPASGSWHDAGTVVSCTANANAGWGWVEWSGALSGTENPKDLTMDSPKSITANFFQPTLTVFNPIGYGNPVPAVGACTCNYGASVTCSVSSPTDSEFDEGFESGFGWTTGGDANWFATTDDKHSGTYSVRSGDLYRDRSSYIERTFTIGPGGGQVMFWWKNSSSSSGNELGFSIDGSQQAYTLSTSWGMQTHSLSEGTHTLKWEYYREDEEANGWIDDIIVTNTNMTSSAFTEGFESAWITGGDPGVGGDVNWSVTSDRRHSGTYSAQSGDISDYGNSYIERTFIIPEEGGTVTFWWKASSEGGPWAWPWIYDWLEFYIDDVRKDGICGIRQGEAPNYTYEDTVWAQKTYLLDAGVRTLKWRYKKDSSQSELSDCGWIDDIAIQIPNSPSYICTGYDGTGSCPSGSGSSVTFTITSHSSITWNWKIMYKLSVSIEPSSGGTVDFSPTPTLGSYFDPGTVVTLTATANSGYLFGHWTGDLSGDANPETLTMNSRKDVTAHFTGQNKPSNFVGAADSTTAITWSWTSDNSDWQSIAAGVLRTVATTLSEFQGLYGDLPGSETCPRDGSGNDRLLFEATDDLPDVGGDQDCPTISVAAADTYTITYTRLTDSTWTCTADTYLTCLYDYYIDDTGYLKQAISTGDGCQADSGSVPAPYDVWFEIHKVAPAGSSVTVYPNITSYQETGLSENTQYTRHVHAVNAGVAGDPSNDASKYTLIRDATTSHFSLAADTTTITRTIGAGSFSQRCPIDIAYDYARCQMLLYGNQMGTYITDEIGQGGVPGKITKIRFQRAYGDWMDPGDTVNNAEIYMAHTMIEMLPSTWTDTTSHTLVYSGNLSIPYGNDGTWYEIPLSPVFSYDGSSNLLISFRHQDGSREDNYTTWRTTRVYYGSSDPPYFGGRSIWFYDNVQNPPTVPTNQNTTYFPNIQLGIRVGCVTITVTVLPPNSTSGLTGVRIERATASSFADAVVVQTYQHIYTMTDAPLVGGDYWYRIRFRNGDAIPSAYSGGRVATVPAP